MLAWLTMLQNDDTTLVPLDDDTGRFGLRFPALSDALPMLVIDPLFLAQSAVAQILGGAVAVLYDGDAVARNEARHAAKSRIAGVTLDMPKDEQDVQPLSVTIMEGEDGTTFDETFHGWREVDEDALPDNVYGEEVGFARVPLEITGIASHTGERRALRGVIINSLIAEPRLQAGGRTVVIKGVPTVVRLTLERVRNADDPDSAKQNLRFTLATVIAELPVIRVSWKPAKITPKSTTSVE